MKSTTLSLFFHYFPDDILYEQYRFSAEGMCYIRKLAEPYFSNVTEQSRVMIQHKLCTALLFVATGTYMSSFGDPETPPPWLQLILTL